MRSSALRYSGRYSLRHHSTADSSYAVRQIVPGIVPGQRYAISGWTNIPATSDAFTYRIEVVWRSASGAALRIDLVKAYSVATSRWVWSGITRLPPAGVTSAVVRMNVSSLSATIYADAFAFRQAP